MELIFVLIVLTLIATPFIAIGALSTANRALKENSELRKKLNELLHERSPQKQQNKELKEQTKQTTTEKQSTAHVNLGAKRSPSSRVHTRRSVHSHPAALHPNVRILLCILRGRLCEWPYPRLSDHMEEVPPRLHQAAHTIRLLHLHLSRSWWRGYR